MRLSLPFLFAVGLLAGCTPQDADVTGSYVAFFAAASSQNILELGYNGVDLTDPEVLDKRGFTPIDCRFGGEDNVIDRLANADYTKCTVDGTAEGAPILPKWQTWLMDYSYFKKEEALDPYRVEVVMTSEHDLQMTVHVDGGKLGDFRFGWVIDPVFQPEVCVDTPDGPQLAPVDGDWVSNWSATDPNGGSLFFLNAGAYQVNPSNSADYWSLPQDWLAGYSFGQYGSEAFYGHASDYTETILVVDGYAYDGTERHDFDPNFALDADGDGVLWETQELTEPIYYPAYPYYLTNYGLELPELGVNPDSNQGRYPSYDDFYAAYSAKFDPTSPNFEVTDFATLGQSEFPLQMRLEDNAWRIADEAEAELESSSNYAYGMENWVSVSSSWVHFDLTPAEMQALNAGSLDKPLTGTFQVALDTAASATKVYVSGSFSIDKIRKDVWGYERTLDEEKRDENNTPVCGEDRLTTDPV